MKSWASQFQPEIPDIMFSKRGVPDERIYEIERQQYWKAKIFREMSQIPSQNQISVFQQNLPKIRLEEIDLGREFWFIEV